jgi:RHS repeat-associated protein
MLALWVGFAVIALFSSATAKAQQLLPSSVAECEGNSGGQTCGNFTLFDQDQFSATWQNGAIATITAQEWDNDHVTLSRVDTTGTSAGLTAEYSGQLQGDTVSGTVTWVWPGHPGFPADGTWSGTFTSAPPVQPGKLNGNHCPFCGDPINVPSGNMFEQVNDYHTAGQNVLSFSRSYNSRPGLSTEAVSLGTGWRSNYDRYIRILPSNVVMVERPDGQEINFTQNRRTWVTDSDVDITLAETGSTWTLTDHDDTVETYTTTGAGDEALLNSIKARNGYTQTLSYNGNNQLRSVTDSYGRSLNLTYSNGLLQTVTTPDALVLTFTYTAVAGGDQLTSVSYNTNPVTSQTYFYEAPNLPFALTGILDENGNRYATWSYDAYARGISSALGGSLNARLTTVAYNDSDDSRVVTNAFGVPDTYTFTRLQGVPKETQISRAATPTTAAATETFSYDSNGYVASQTDWNGNQTTYVNDSHGDPLTITEAVGSPVQRITTIVYDPAFPHLPDTITTPGVTTSYTYDGSGNPLTRTSTDTTTQNIPYSTHGETQVWTYTWNNSLLASVENPNLKTTNYSYSSSGAVTKITNPLNQATNITLNSGGGYPETIVDPNSVTTTLTYDARQRLTSSAVTTSLGVLTTTYTIDPASELTKVTLPDNSFLGYGYDTAHRKTQLTDAIGNYVQYTLDLLGDKTQTNTYDNTSTLKRQHSATFDALGRMLTDVGGVGQTTTYTYDSNGNALTITDPLNNKTTQVFDGLNRITTSTDPANGVTTISYDAHDRPLTVTDPNSGQTAYTYDGFGNAIQQVSPDSGTAVYYYDRDDNRTKRIAATGAITQNTYDALDRVSTTTYPSDPAENVAYTYDQGAGHGFGIGRLTSVSDAAGSLSRSYDERGNVTQEIRNIGSVGLGTYYAYDAVSRVARIAYPSKWQASYTRDSAGRITAVTARQLVATAVPPPLTIPVVSNVTYEPFGPVAGLAFGNNIVESRSFDLDYRLNNLADVGTGNIQNLTYGYDLDDNVKTIMDAVNPGNSQSFGYDVLNRLSGASGGYGNYSWTYNKISSRLSETLSGITTTYGYGAKNNQLLTLSVNGVVTQTIGYTADGNTNSFNPGIMSPGDQLITGLNYNQAAQLGAVMSGSEALGQYTYDGFGQRLVKTLSGSVGALYQHDLDGRLLEETDVHGVAQADYIYLNGTPVATISPSAKAVYFLHDDRLGTPQLATDSGQNAVWSATYLPFGGTGSVHGLITQNLRFPGQHFDSESGWNHNGFRDYAQNWGRYLQTDLIGLRGGLNSYLYANADPLKFTDRLGLEPSWWSRFWEANQRAHETELAGAIDAINGIRSTAKMYSRFAGYDALLDSTGGLFSDHICAAAAEDYLGAIVVGPLIEGAVLDILGNASGAAIEAFAAPHEDQLLGFPFVRDYFTNEGLDYTGQRVIGHVGDEAYSKWWYYNNVTH